MKFTRGGEDFLTYFNEMKLKTLAKQGIHLVIPPTEFVNYN